MVLEKEQELSGRGVSQTWVSQRESSRLPAINQPESTSQPVDQSEQLQYHLDFKEYAAQYAEGSWSQAYMEQIENGVLSLPEGTTMAHVMSFEMRQWIIPMQVVTILGIAMKAITFLLAQRFARCSDGVATYPIWLWITYAPEIVVKIYVEWMIIRKWSFPFSMFGRFKILGCQVPLGRHAFSIWFLFHGASSLLNVADNGSDTLFAAATMESTTCPQSQLEFFWQDVWKESVFAKVHVPAPSVYMMVACFWSFSLIQSLWPLLRTLQACSDHESYPYVQMPKEGFFDVSEKALLHPSFGDATGQIFHSQVVFALADATGMASIQIISIPVRGAAIEYFFSNPKYAHCSAKAALNIAVDIRDRVLLSFGGENTVQLSLQSTLYMLHVGIARSKGQSLSTAYQFQALLSLGIGISMSVLKLSEVLDFFSATKLAANIQHEVLDQNDNAKIAFRQFMRCRRVIIGGMALLIWTLTYVIVKLAMMRVCESAMWNLTGCVDKFVVEQ